MMFRRLLMCAAVCGAALSVNPRAFAANITVERSDRGAVVKIDGQLFTEYLIRSGSKPILWPIIGPTGKPMTRDYPMCDERTEKKDHHHHRSLWFTHGDVNGLNFWAEQEGAGRTEHVEFTKLAGGSPAVVATRNAWIGPDGKKVCEDRRTLRFDADDDARWIDFDIEIKATDGAVTFGDTKEGTFGVRVADSLRVEAGRGGKIINSRRQVNENAWGQPAEWTDYHGPIDGQTLGIAIMNHPGSFRYPTFWHVRTYGLFAANPFGVHDFTEGKRSDGEATIPAGKSIVLRYRVLLHCGDEREGRVAERFKKYAAEAK